MTLEQGLAYFLEDPLRSLVQIPTYAVIIGLPSWLIYRYAKKRVEKQEKKKLES